MLTEQPLPNKYARGYNPGMKYLLSPEYLKRALIPIALCAIPAFSQPAAVKKVPAPPTTAISGSVLFSQYCGACHGSDAKGHGPAAPALKVAPGDLTNYAKRNGGRFPEEKFMRLMRGEESVAAHGSSDMPVWGPTFGKMSPDPSMTQTRLHALLDYLEKLQSK